MPRQAPNEHFPIAYIVARVAGLALFVAVAHMRVVELVGAASHHYLLVVVTIDHVLLLLLAN